MNEVRSTIRSARKVDELIKFSLDYHDLRYLRKIKHTGSKKLVMFKNVHDDIVVHFKVPLFCFSVLPSFVPPNKKRKIIVNTLKFDVKDYDKDEIFNLSTIHDVNLLRWLQVFCTCTQSRRRHIEVFPYITQDLLYEAHSAFSTQYEKIDEEKYQVYRGR